MTTANGAQVQPLDELTIELREIDMLNGNRRCVVNAEDCRVWALPNAHQCAVCIRTGEAVSALCVTAEELRLERSMTKDFEAIVHNQEETIASNKADHTTTQGALTREFAEAAERQEAVIQTLQKELSKEMSLRPLRQAWIVAGCWIAVMFTLFVGAALWRAYTR